jgi:CO/xanthine dehydrogenase Mo-binding subunit
VLPGVGNLFDQMREQDAKGLAAAAFAVNTGNFDAAYAAAPIKLSQSYRYHYNGSMAMGPECCVAVVTPAGARIFSNTQNAYGLRETIKAALDPVLGTKTIPVDRIRVTYYEGGSTYGPAAPYDDAAQAAAVMSALTGKPVRVQFMRWDSHGWGNYGPPLLADLRGAVDANGTLAGLEFTGFAFPYYATAPTAQQVGGEMGFPTAGNLNTVLNGEQYSIANRRVIGKTMPLRDNYFKMRHLRAPLAPQTSFATEQLVDELAFAAKMDPLAFRLKNVATTATDRSQRWRNVLESVAAMASWRPRVAASSVSPENVVTGRGIAFGHYSNSPSAGVVDVEVNKKSGKIAVKRMFIAVDAGFIAYPDGLHSNEEGAAIQGVSRALEEQVVFDRRGVTSTDWVTYPVLRFKDAPAITLKGLQRTDVQIDDATSVAAGGSRSTGGGEPGVVPVPAAIANAFFDATGVRVREAPMTPGRVRAVLKAAGK